MGEPDASVAAGSHMTIGTPAELGEGNAWLDDGAGETIGFGEGAGEQAVRTRVAKRSSLLIATS
jgi:hypothetical protein